MIALTYNARVVLALFTQAKPGKLNPSEDDIQKFDRQLKSGFDDDLVDAMGRAGIPVTVENKSQVLAYRPNMPGTDEVQIENACTFFVNTSTMFGPGGAAPDAAPLRRSTPKKTTRQGSRKRQ